MMRIDPWSIRFHPSRTRGHVESYFVRINDPVRPRALWIKATILKRTRGEAVAESWAIAFDRERGHIAHKKTVPYASARFGEELEVAGCAWSRARVKGSLGELTWDLALKPHGAPLYSYPHPRMYTGPLPSQKTLLVMPDLFATGTARVRGETWDVSKWRGVLGHNWGARHTHLYAWGHVSEWQGIGASPEGASDLVLEASGGRVRVGPIVLPMLAVISVRWRGVRYDWSSLRDMRRTSSRIDDFRRWSFAAKNDLGTIEAELEADTGDFVGLVYENPSGKPTYCLNSKLARAKVRLALSGRAPFEAASERAAFEIGTHDPRHGVRMYA
jgi:hypothetical protein